MNYPRLDHGNLAVCRRKGGSYATPLAENVNELYKAERIHRRAPKKTREAVERAALGWGTWLNRLLEPLGYVVG